MSYVDLVELKKLIVLGVLIDKGPMDYEQLLFMVSGLVRSWPHLAKAVTELAADGLIEFQMHPAIKYAVTFKGWVKFMERSKNGEVGEAIRRLAASLNGDSKRG